MKEETRVRLIGGKKAIKYRSQLAALANQKKPTVASIKLPIEIDLPTSKYHQGIRKANDVVRGVGSGTLFSLLVDPQLAGARIYNASSRTVLHRNRKILDPKPFAKAFKKAWGTEFEGMSPSAFILYAEKSRRTDTDPVIDPEKIRDELYFLCGTSINSLKRAEKDPHPGYFELCSLIGVMFAETLKEYKQIRLESESALALIDTAIINAGIHAPSLVTTVNSIVKLPVEIKTSTIDFDDSDPAIYTGKEIKALGEYRLHTLVAKRLAEARLLEEKPETYLKTTITTFQYSGMSWLFNPNAGLGAIQDADNETLAEWYPEATKDAIELLKKTTQSIPKTNVFNTGWHAYRAGLAGSTESWMSNYYKRLADLQKTLDELTEGNELIIPAALKRPEAQVFFNGAGIDYGILEEAVKDIWARRTSAQKAIGVLFGTQSEKVTPETVPTIEEFSARLYMLSGYLNQIQSATDREIRNAGKSDDRERLELALNCQWTLEKDKDKKEVDLDINPVRPEWVKPLDKINKISGGSQDIKAEIADAAARFQIIHNQAWAHHMSLRDWVKQETNTTSPLHRYEGRELVQLRRSRLRPTEITELAKHRALRKLLSRWLEQAQQCSEPVKNIISAAIHKTGVFEKPSQLNRFLYNRKGYIYVSYFNLNRRNRPVDLIKSTLRSTDWMDVFFRQIGLLQQHAVQVGGQVAIADYIRMERTYLRFITDMLPDRVPAEQIRHPILEDAAYPMPPQISSRLEGEEVTQRAASTALNHYHSMLMDITAILFKQRFIERYALQRSGDNMPVYAPKQTRWRVPARHYKHGDIQHVLNDPAVESCRANESLSIPEAFVAAVKKKQPITESLGAYLMQAPHDWYFDIGLIEGQTLTGAKVLTKASGAERKAQGSPYQPEINKPKELSGLARIIGPSSFKNRFDKMLTAGTSRIGDITLVVEAEYTLQASLQEDGSVTTELTPPRLQPFVSIPMTDATDHGAASEDLYNRMIAIDLGERNIGWACFDIESKTLIDSGKVRLRSMLNLMRREVTGGKPNKQKFKNRFGTVLEELRENVVGDISNTVLSLMSQFNAFPIFESEPDSLERGPSQNRLVYKAVLERFTFTSVPAQKTARQSYWLGGNLWKVPHLKVWKGAAGNRKVSELNLFPGGSVHPAGTSQECSECKRNPIASIWEKGGKKAAKQQHVEKGVLVLDNGEISLLKKPRLTAHEVRMYKKRKQRVPLTEAIKTDMYKTSDIIRIAKLNLRRANASMQSKDSLVSQYHCLYTDCGHTMHAEINAAVNIGNKWLVEKLATEEESLSA